MITCGVAFAELTPAVIISLHLEHFLRFQTIVRIEDCAVHLENPTDTSSPPKTFTYDSSYDSNSPTEAIYNDICYSLVEVCISLI